MSAFEEFMADVFNPQGYKPKPPEDPFQTEEYQRFVDSMVPHCHCKESNRPCDGVLAGGLCDDVQDEPDEEESCDECGQRVSLCDCWP